MSSVFFGGSRPIHDLHAYAKAYANLRGLRGVPTQAQVSFQAPTRMPTRANAEFECRSALWQLQLRSPHLSKDLAARKGLRTQNALKASANASANAYAGPTRRLQHKQKEGKRSKFIYTWQTALSHDLFNKRLREKPTRGVTQQPTR